jgi:hypothetical protein
MVVLGGLLTVLAVVPSAPSAPSAPSTYYVSSQGDDANGGRSPQTAWRTLNKVANVPLHPGDIVFLRGGDTFVGPLKTQSSGAAGAPIVFTSYAQGWAQVTGSNDTPAVYFNSNRFLTFSKLDVSAPRTSCILTSARGTGSSDVLFDDLRIHGCGDAGLSANNVADARITLTNSTVANTQGCGIIFSGADFRIGGNEIRNTGLNASGSLTYPLHGIYGRGLRPTIADNRIFDFQTAGITIRSTGSDVEHNTIVALTRGQRGISYYQETDTKGTTRIVANTIDAVSVQGIAIDNGSTTSAFGGGPVTASTSETFVVKGNAVNMGGDTSRYVVEGIRLLRVPSAVITLNRVGGRLDRVYTGYGPPGAYSEGLNDWRSDASSRAFSWNGARMTFAQYAASSGQGVGDTLGRSR